jgi:Alkylmercury lyase
LAHTRCNAERIGGERALASQPSTASPLVPFLRRRARTRTHTCSSGERVTPRDSEIRLWIYQYFVDNGRAPSPLEIATHFQLTPDQVEHILHRLQSEADALVLIPGSSYIWMAEPFSAVPTSFLVRSGDRQWWGNCIWDALAILALLGVDGSVATACPHSGLPLLLAVTEHSIVPVPAVVHFAVPARDWWRDIGFT